jgi:hypothetical protein
MKYRATLNDPGNLDQKRPVQILSNSRDDIDKWAALQLAAAISPDAAVTIYMTVEQQIGLTLKAKEVPPPK